MNCDRDYMSALLELLISRLSPYHDHGQYSVHVTPVCDRCHRQTQAKEWPYCLCSWENANGSTLAKVEGVPWARRAECVCPRKPAEWREAWLRGGKTLSRAWGQDRSDLRAAWSWNHCLECVWLMNHVAHCGLVTASENWMYRHIVLEGILSLDPEDLDLSFCFAPKQQPDFGIVSDHWLHQLLLRRKWY